MKKSTSLFFVASLNFLVLFGTASAIQEPLAKTSLDIAPIDCSFYFASMNHDEIVAAVEQSRAYQSLWETPLGSRIRRAMRKGRGGGFEQFGNNPVADMLEGYTETFENAGVRLAWPFFEEALKNELFIFADKNYIQLNESINELYAEVLAASATDEELDPAVLVDALATKIDSIEIPFVVIGCVLDNPQNFRGLIETGTTFIDSSIEDAPPELDFLVDGYKIEKSENGFLVTVTVDGSKLPDELFEEMAMEEATVAKLREVVGKKSVKICAGVMDNLMLISFGPSDASLDALKKGEKLIDHPRLADVRAVLASEQKPLLLSWYAAESVQIEQSFENGKQMMKSMMEIMLNEEAPDNPRNDELVKEVARDLDDLMGDLKQYISEPADGLTFAYMTPRGIEGFSKSWSVSSFVDSSRPIDLISHVGESPAILVASRSKDATKQFETASKWVDRVFHYVEEYVPDYMEDQEEFDRKQFEEITGELQGIWNTVSNATSKHLMPATENGEVAMFIDLSNRRTSWTAEMPDVGIEVPVPNLGMIMDCRDRSAMGLAGAEYWNAANSTFRMIARLAEDTDFKADAGLEQFIAPVITNENGNVRVSFDFESTFTELAGEAFKPELLLSDKYLIASSLGNCQGLLSERSPAFFGPAGEKVPAATIFFMDFRKCVDFGESWSQYGIEAARREGVPFEIKGEGESDLLDLNEEELTETVDAGIQFLKCFYGISARSSVEDDATVTRFQMRFEDLDSEINFRNN